MAAKIGIKRVYDAPAEDDGERILVDRIWPRGLSKEQAALSSWLKEIAPSTELRKWFGHDPERFAEFSRRYRAEIDANPDAAAELRRHIAAGKVTLLYAAHDADHNNARVLAEYFR